LVSLYRRKSFLAKELSADNLIKIKKCVALHFALLAAVNSQVLTGFALEMESHYRYVYYIFLTVAILIIFEITRKRFRFNLLKIESSNLIYILFFIVYLVYLSLQFESVRPQQTFKSQIIKQVNENKNIKSLLIRDSSDLYVLRSQFIYLTNVYLYWGPGAEFSKISNGEILKRKTCSQSSLLSYNQFLRSDLSALPRNLINETKRVERLNKFLKYIGFRVNTTPINFLFENEYKLYLEYAQECSAADFEFRADLVLD
jgi:hypothetical protein